MRDIFAQLRENNIPLMERNMVERSAFKVPFRLGGTIYELTEKETSNPQAAIDNAEEFAQEIRDVLFGKKPATETEEEEVTNHVR
jgi:chromosome partitioning protein